MTRYNSFVTKSWGVLAPIFICFLFILSCPAADEHSLWPDREHPATGYISLDAGASYINFTPGGYGNVKNANQSIIAFQTELMGSNVPVFSKFRLISTFSGDFSGNSFEASKQTPSLFYGFVELKSPFTFGFLSHNTNLYFQYSRSYRKYNAKLTSDINYKGSYIVEKGQRITLGESSQFFAVAVNTPITMEDTIYSYSRFGLYYTSTERPRSATLPESAEAWMFNTQEWHSGLFYNISKPVLFDGFIIGLYLNAGFGMRDLLSNDAGYSTGDFDSSHILLFSGVNAEISYRIDIAKNVSLRLNTGYEYNGASSMQGKSTTSGEFRNNSSQQYKFGGVFNVFF